MTYGSGAERMAVLAKSRIVLTAICLGDLMSDSGAVFLGQLAKDWLEAKASIERVRQLHKPESVVNSWLDEDFVQVVETDTRCFECSRIVGNSTQQMVWVDYPCVTIQTLNGVDVNEIV